MGSQPATTDGHAGDGAELHCRFGVAPPRRFLYPALLLLLAEEPGHGYLLVEGLRRLGLGPVSRPNVYRALADLCHDGLLRSCSAEPTAGSTRYVYSLTDAGRRQLEAWMQVVAFERDALDRVVDRFLHWRHDTDGHDTLGRTLTADKESD